MNILGPTRSTLPPRASHRYTGEQLPSLKDVKHDVETLKRWPDFFSWLDTDEGLQNFLVEMDYELKDHPIALTQLVIWSMFVPSLLKFCRSVLAEDVPEEILQEYMWIQRKNIRCFTDMPQDEQISKVPGEFADVNIEYNIYQVRLVNIFGSHSNANDGPKLLYFRQNLADCLLSPQINQMEDGVAEYATMVEEYKSHLHTVDSPNEQTPWLERPMLFTRYAEARVLCNFLDHETKLLLERCLEGMTKAKEKINDLPLHFILTRMSLVLVLHVLDVEPEKQKAHTDWTVYHLHKRPQFKERVLEFLFRSGQLSHPVLAELPADWYQDKPYTEKEARSQERRCAHCERERPVVQKLKVCTTCKLEYYCSEECKNADRPRHHTQAYIRSHVSADVLKQLDTASKWEMTNGNFNSTAVIHALALPLDISRARTHIVVRTLVPDTRARTRTVRDKLHVSELGVFKIEDALPLIQPLLRDAPNVEEARSIVSQMLLQDPDNVRVLCLSRTRLQDQTCTLGVKIFTFPQTQIRRMVHDPTWRDKVNGDRPPPEIPILRGVADSEFDYDLVAPLTLRNA
ncbi:hypothetical protein EIP91_004138 [Steccherinum ochraceum]|uniref:MYND-type domain-containing protein n=1 Tax=Steccherinum ochraceum TaxID=92696 RepID=A0A4R0R9B6_9APHY|nr:hypothetical protein EIP91_004138 [Steccherinum ochraceum]